MRVIITGGTGLIGSALANNLIQDGCEVIVLTRSPQRRPAELAPQVRLVGWDGRSAGGWSQFVDGADALVNLAGESLAAGRWTPDRKRRILESRLNAGKAVVEAVRQARRKPGLVLQASAIGYYGLDPQQVYPETGPAGQGFESQVVRAWEQSTQEVESLGVRRVVMRISVVFSLHGGALPRLLLPFKLFAGGPLGGGKQPMTWVHISDLVQAMRFFLSHPETNGVYNIAAPDMPDNASFARSLGAAMGRPAVLPAPALAIRLLFGEMATVVLDGRRVSADKLQAAGFQFQYPRVEPALRNLLETKQ